MTTLLELLGYSELAEQLLGHWLADDDTMTLPQLLMTARSVCARLHVPLHQWLKDVFDTARMPATTMTRFSMQFHFSMHFPADYHAFVTLNHRWFTKGNPRLDALVTMASFIAMARAETWLLHHARWDGTVIKYNRHSSLKGKPDGETPLRDVFYYDARTRTLNPLRDLPELTECVFHVDHFERQLLARDAQNSLDAFLFMKAMNATCRYTEHLVLWYYYSKKETAVHGPPRDTTLMKHVFIDKVPLYSPCSRVMETLRSVLFTYDDATLDAGEKQLAVTLSQCMTALSQRFFDSLGVTPITVPFEPMAITLGVDRQFAARRELWGTLPSDRIYDSDDDDGSSSSSVALGYASSSDDWQEMSDAEKDVPAMRNISYSDDETAQVASSTTSTDDDMPPLG